MMTNTKLDLGRFGVFGLGVTPDQAKDIEALGYGAVWVAGSPPAELDWVEPILENTATLQRATGVVNIWSAEAGRVAESFHRIEKAHPGRFLLGIGVGHPEADQEFRKPIDAINDYLDKLDEYGVPKARRVLAALGPQLLKLSARRVATPNWSSQTRLGELRCRYRIAERDRRCAAGRPCGGRMATGRGRLPSPAIELDTRTLNKSGVAQSGADQHADLKRALGLYDFAGPADHG
jgi:hypothetical protein